MCAVRGRVDFGSGVHTKEEPDPGTHLGVIGLVVVRANPNRQQGKVTDMPFILGVDAAGVLCFLDGA